MIETSLMGTRFDKIEKMIETSLFWKGRTYIGYPPDGFVQVDLKNKKEKRWIFGGGFTALEVKSIGAPYFTFLAKYL